MTTHEGHDHPNTKAGRAACRRAALQGQAPTTDKQGSQNRHPAGKKGHVFVANDQFPDQCATCAQNREARIHRAKRATLKRKADTADPSLPHAYDEDMERAKRCYICKRGEGASVHTEGPRDLGKLLNFFAR